MSEAVVKRRRSPVSAIWAVPVLAAALGLWVVVDSHLSAGPQVRVTFRNASGLKAGETAVRCLSVDVGLVHGVQLGTESDSVDVVLQLDSNTEKLLSADTQFWVVRPRVGVGGISGLSTLLSGAYVELSPGSTPDETRSYVGLDEAPVTPQSAPGVRVQLVSDRAGSVSVGSPVMHNGFAVGRVEQANLEVQDGKAHYGVFVRAPFDALLTTNTRFWNAGGLSIEAGTNGFEIHTESLETLISGGVAFSVPEQESSGGRVTSGHKYLLYPNMAATTERIYEWSIEYLLLFDTSVRGLHPGAPVEYRGVRVGTVMQVSFDLVGEEEGWSPAKHARVPVLIRMDPGRFGPDEEVEMESAKAFMEEAVKHGLRASLGTGSLLTGNLFVEFDYYSDAEKAAVHTVAGRSLLPTVDTGFAHLQQQVSELLGKLEALPVEQLLLSATSTMETIDGVGERARDVLASVDSLLAGRDLQGILEQANIVLTELRVALKGVSPNSAAYGELMEVLRSAQAAITEANKLLQVLEERPSSIIFSSSKDSDLVPGRKR